MPPGHVFIVKRTDYKGREDEDEEVEEESDVLGVHYALKSANNQAMCETKDYPFSDEWDEVDKDIETRQDGAYRITCGLWPHSVHDTDHFIIKVERHMVSEGHYPNEGDDDSAEDDEDDEEHAEDDGPAERSERPVKRQRS
ncbi:hypothetical protein Slin15195_G025670 [Septoria linicola]|uniref:Uncharacterized protein n=1 Tax=Septoria linicola TaxID=215465 RepID=A0A9Q9EHF2_9PEZI|nr:hypothetical protein Slin15195_G025670 [Septoria linicola]